MSQPANDDILVMMKHHTMKMHQKMKEEYDIWAMEMEHYLEYIDNDVWKKVELQILDELAAKRLNDEFEMLEQQRKGNEVLKEQ
ncbi:hypothetical protein Tco_0279978, partial [Tanacetum coccineum]